MQCCLILGNAGFNNVPWSTTTTPFDTNLNHIVIIINRTTDKALLYMNTIKDSVEIDISSVPADISNEANVSWGARHDGILPYEGILDEMRVYSGLPTQEKINTLYRIPGGFAPTSPTIDLCTPITKRVDLKTPVNTKIELYTKVTTQIDLKTKVER